MSLGERFTIHVDGLPAAVWRSGDGPALLLAHGVGPGTTAAANFGPLLPALARRFSVFATDLMGFGASGRKCSAPYFDVALWLCQLEAILDGSPAPWTICGNSVGGALALKVAARRSDRCAGVVAIGAPCAPFVMPAALRAFWRAPNSIADLAAAMRPLSAARSHPPTEIVEERYRIFADPAERNYFAGMVERDGAALIDELALTPDEAARIACPVTLVYGREDAVCPPDAILPRILPLLPRADVVLLGGCGHTVAQERGDALLALTSLNPPIPSRSPSP